DAKPTSPNYQKFLEQYGGKAVELDACPVDLIQNKLREAIESIIDVDEFNVQVELEKSDAAQVAAYRRVVLQAITEA
ncbi:chromosome partitioning protein ParB, partial [Candidatus Kaiserbacteria bacterium]|nr:chromosome partitioning protein ParB [Candidatus Kaiserbacteria bacterium]